MNGSRILFLISVLFSFVSFSISAQNQKIDRVLESFLKSESLKHAGIGLCVRSISDGGMRIAYNEQLSLIPASTLKLVSSAAALDYLDKSYTFEIPFYYTGDISLNGTLNGDIIFGGSNDPSFGSRFANRMPENIFTMVRDILKEKGIKSINGRIVVDDLAIREEPVFPPKWMWEDLGNYYAPAVYGFSFMDNTYELSLRSANEMDRVKVVKTDPAIAELTFENSIRIDDTQSNNVYVNGIPYSYHRILSGTMKANQTNYRIKGEIPDPALFFAVQLTKSLKENHIPVSGEPTTTRLSDMSSIGRTHLSSFASPSLDKQIRIINFQSNNHYAEHVLAEFERKSGLNLNEYWKSKGINADGQFIYDGSGLSPANAVSARFLTDILLYMQQESNSSEAFYLSLPLAGKEGTVGSFLKGSILEGKARIKSGSMTNVHTYAGYIRYEGELYAFALLVNNYTGTRSELRRQIERLLCGLF